MTSQAVCIDLLPAGAAFPPRDAWDIAAYGTDDVVAGYRDHRPDDHAPGPNHSPAYRWGWTNRRRDTSGEDDGFDGVRFAYLDLCRRAQ